MEEEESKKLIERMRKRIIRIEGIINGNVWGWKDEN